MELVVTSCPVAGIDSASEWGTGGGTIEPIGMVPTSGRREVKNTSY